MSWREQALCFSCQGAQLLGVLASPADAALASGTGVVVVVGGPQYRAGAHRQFVQLARALAAQGHSVLRFDVRGMGDSSGAQRNFEDLSDDIRAAVDALVAAAPACNHVVLMGLCDGASASLLYLHETGDSRVRALCLLNPWVRSETSLAQTHLKHYYMARVLQRDFWRKLLRGGVGLTRLAEFARSVRLSLTKAKAASTQGVAKMPFQQAMATAWRRFDGRIFLALSGEDLTAREFTDNTARAPAWRGLPAAPNVERLELNNADHTLSNSVAQAAFEQAVLRWLRPAVAAS